MAIYRTETDCRICGAGDLVEIRPAVDPEGRAYLGEAEG
jgi:hypothetical protein